MTRQKAGSKTEESNLQLAERIGRDASRYAGDSPGATASVVGPGVVLWLRWFLPNSQAAEQSQQELWLRVNSTLTDRVCDPVDRKHVGRDAIVDTVSVCIADNVVE